MRIGDKVHNKEICVLVDRVVGSENFPPKRARTSLWTNVLPPDSFDEVSISDEKRANRQVRINAAHLVIVNWDAANGDYICGSDDTFLYFITRQDRRDALLQNGGILLSEFQSGRGQPYQAAYDAIFGPAQIRVVDAKIPPHPTEEADESKWNNSSVRVFPKFHNFHPLTKDLGSKLHSRYVDGGPLFNFNAERPQETFYWYRYRTSLYNGWFVGWDKGWVPLLTADFRYPRSALARCFIPPAAVLLAKCQDNGLMLASTMWIAGSNCKELIDSIRRVNVADVRSAHQRIKRSRCFWDSVLFLVFALTFYCFYHWSPWYPMKLQHILEDAGFTWIGIVSFLGWWHLIWRRPYGVGVAQHARQGLGALRDSI